MLLVKVKDIVYRDTNMNFDNFPEPIQQMMYQVTSNKQIVMEGFDSYLRIKEMVKGVNCKIDGTSKIFLFGRALHRTAVIEINLITNKIENYIVRQGQEYNGRLSKNISWKKGVSGKSNIYIKDTETD